MALSRSAGILMLAKGFPNCGSKKKLSGGTGNTTSSKLSLSSAVAVMTRYKK